MLLKLSMSGVKSKFKDYLVLLFGLVMAISIFYMFETLALNEEFVKANSTIKSIMSVFQIGSVLLAIITVFYIIYANSFLLLLRQKEFGMYMMLGAKKKKVTLIMFIETLVIGAVSLVIGIIIGGILSKIISYLLMTQLNFEGGNYYPFYMPSISITCIFFVILFLVAAILNSVTLFKSSVLQLLHAESKSDTVKVKPMNSIFKAVLAIILLIGGYISIINIKVTMVPGLFVGMITITAGTYLLFMAFVPTLIEKLFKNKRIKTKGLNVFTLSQLSFRVKELTKVLATVAMLIALSAGAISAGMAFKNNVKFMADDFYYYDITLNNPTQQENNIIGKINAKEKLEYRYKKDNEYIYYLSSDLSSNRPIVLETDTIGEVAHKERIDSKLNINSVYDTGNQDDKWSKFFYDIENKYTDSKLKIKVVDEKEFSRLKGNINKAVVIKANDFTSNLDELKKLDDIEKARYKVQDTGSKYAFYNEYYSMTCGMVFMGLFLGIAFLGMMASCLMFKILTGATKDIKRYEMLRKIGVRKSLLTKSIYKELGFIYGIPAIVGIAHVLIGMQMFRVLLLHPYYHIWISLSVFGVIYLIYYFITVKLYRNIVLPKRD